MCSTLQYLQNHWNPEKGGCFYKESVITLKSVSQPMHYKIPDPISSSVEYCICLCITSIHHGNVRVTRECVLWGKEEEEIWKVSTYNSYCLKKISLLDTDFKEVMRNPMKHFMYLLLSSLRMTSKFIYLTAYCISY